MLSVEFYFVGRLTEEKGFSWILDAATTLSEQGITNFAIHVIGSGFLVDDLLQHRLYEKNLFYHGRLPKEQTIGLRKNAHYTLMPSQFLETFGLVALDSIALGIPVIGQKKGGLSPFIMDAYAVDSLEKLVSCMGSCIRSFSIEQRKKESIIALKTASEYTSHKRLDRVGQLSNAVKKSYLLISDYAVDIGGIENFVLQTQRILELGNATTLFIGKKKRVIGKRRIIDLFVALCNIQFSYQIFTALKNTNYDIVWLHSVQRRIGRLPLLVLSRFHKKEIWVMYHDFGLIHPFPSAVHEESQLVRAASFSGYLAEGKMILGKKRYRGGYILIVGKYLYSSMLLGILRRIAHVHLVPSEYLVEHFARRGITTQVLPHFVSHAQPWSDN